MRAAFIPALPPSALMGGMIAPSFRLVNRLAEKKLLRMSRALRARSMLCAVFSWSPLAYVLLRTFGRRERPPALCPLFSWYPLACVKGSLPFDRSLWHGPSVGRGGVFLLYILGYISPSLSRQAFYILGYIPAPASLRGLVYPRLYYHPRFSAKRRIS